MRTFHWAIAAVAAALLAPGPASAEPVAASLKEQEKLCKGNKRDNCVAAGLAHLNGAGTKRSPKLAIEYGDLGCRLSKLSGELCAGLAEITAPGQPMADPVKHKLYIEGACARGQFERACMKLYPEIQAGRPLPPGFLFGAANACKSPNAEACYIAGQVYARYPNMSQSAALSYRRGCNLKHPASCFRLGEALDAKFAAQDRMIAVDVYKRACEIGSAEACAKFAPFKANYAVRNRIDAGLSSNDQLILVERALELGKKELALATLNRLYGERDPNAVYRLGILYLRGEGVPIDRTKGKQLLWEAGQAGHPEAAFTAYPLYIADGQDIQAGQMLRIASNGGIAEAQGLETRQAAARAQWLAERDRQFAAQRAAEKAHNAQVPGVVERAWQTYFDRTKKEEVCARIREPNGQSHNRCMSKDHFNKYFTTNF